MPLLMLSLWLAWAVAGAIALFFAYLIVSASINYGSYLAGEEALGARWAVFLSSLAAWSIATAVLWRLVAS